MAAASGLLPTLALATTRQPEMTFVLHFAALMTSTTWPGVFGVTKAGARTGSARRRYPSSDWRPGHPGCRPARPTRLGDPAWPEPRCPAEPAPPARPVQPGPPRPAVLRTAQRPARGTTEPGAAATDPDATVPPVTARQAAAQPVTASTATSREPGSIRGSQDQRFPALRISVRPDALAALPVTDMRLGMVDPQGRRTLLPGVLVPRPHRKLTWLLRSTAVSAIRWCLGVLDCARELGSDRLSPSRAARSRGQWACR